MTEEIKRKLEEIKDQTNRNSIVQQDAMDEPAQPAPAPPDIIIEN